MGELRELVSALKTARDGLWAELTTQMEENEKLEAENARLRDVVEHWMFHAAGCTMPEEGDCICGRNRRRREALAPPTGSDDKEK